MAPRRPESRDEFLDRLAKHAASGEARPVRVGAPHHSHAVCNEGGTWRVRRLTLDPKKVEAYRKEHSTFMPEHAEMLSEPGPEIILEAPSLDALITALKKARWPLA